MIVSVSLDTTQIFMNADKVVPTTIHFPNNAAKFHPMEFLTTYQRKLDLNCLQILILWMI